MLMEAMALANAEMGGKFVSLSTVESDAGLAQAERKMGRTWEQLSGMGGAQASLFCHDRPSADIRLLVRMWYSVTR